MKEGDYFLIINGTYKWEIGKIVEIESGINQGNKKSCWITKFYVVDNEGIEKGKIITWPCSWYNTENVTWFENWDSYLEYKHSPKVGLANETIRIGQIVRFFLDDRFQGIGYIYEFEVGFNRKDWFASVESCYNIETNEKYLYGSTPKTFSINRRCIIPIDEESDIDVLYRIQYPRY